MTRQLVEKYLKAARADGLRPTTVKWYSSLLNAFVTWVESRQLQTGTGLTESGVNQVLKRLKKRAGVRGRVNAHSFRHNFAREYIKNGGEIATLAKLLGNGIDVAAGYYAIFTDDELAEMHDQFTPMNQLKVTS